MNICTESRDMIFGSISEAAPGEPAEMRSDDYILYRWQCEP